MKHTLNIFLLAMTILVLVSLVGRPPAPAQAAAVWEIVGTAGFSAGSVGYTALDLDNGTPYVAYTDASNANKASVKANRERHH